MNWMKSFVERILKNKVFWCCVLCVTALSFTAVCYANESGKEYSFWDLFFEGQMRQIFLENDITFESLITNPISIFMAMFMPILVIFPFLNVFWNEKMTNNYLFRQARIGVRKYIVGSMAEAVLSSGLLAVLGRFLYDSNLGNDGHPLLSMETISGNGRCLDGGCGIGAYDRMLLFDKKEVFAWNMVNFQSVKYGI